MPTAIMRRHFIIPNTILAASVGLTTIVGLAPAPDHPIAAVFPPWWIAQQSFSAAAQAGVPIVRTGAFANILVLASGIPDLPRRLRSAGAWLLLDAQALGRCGVNI
jgi:hypothetical protein